MEQPMQTPETVDSHQEIPRPVCRRKSILGPVIVLIVGMIALFVFILVQGDVRRRQRAMEQARWHAATLARRAGETGALPLNLEPEVPPERTTKMFRVEHLALDQARCLRKSRKRVSVAQTVPLPRVFAPDGRAVVFFKDGQFDVEWMTLPEFDRVYAAQQEEIRRLAADAGPDPPNGP